jgi:hypothetical protein
MKYTTLNTEPKIFLLKPALCSLNQLPFRGEVEKSNFTETGRSDLRDLKKKPSTERIKCYLVMGNLGNYHSRQHDTTCGRHQCVVCGPCVVCGTFYSKQSKRKDFSITNNPSKCLKKHVLKRRVAHR